MSEILSWPQIVEKYQGEWVELIDYEWDESEPDPQAGVVRVHAKDRKEFYNLIRHNKPKDSAILYVGDPFQLSSNIVFNANQHQWFKNNEKV